MPHTSHIQYKIDGQTKLLFRLVHISVVLTTVLAILCIYPLHIYGVVPIALFTYGISNLLNIELFKKNGDLKWAAIRSSVISLLVTFTVILFSGGINSPFIFILAVIVLGGYAGARIFGRVYLFAVMGAIFLIYLIDEADFSFFANSVPAESRHHFSLLSLLFAVYLMGGVFGRNLMNAYQAMKKSRAEIEKGIEDKGMLLREVHHRVKNNLQTVSSLLSLQAKNTGNDKIKPLIYSSQNRVTSMAMIHEMLYMRDDLSQIEFRPYVQELTEYLMKSVKSQSNGIMVDIDIPDVNLGIDTAIPLGLLINEAVTNSIKYAFSENSEGKIHILLSHGDAESSYVLEIVDNGIGFSENLDFRTTDSLGLKLIHNLARQLRGSVERVSCDKGTRYRIEFFDFERRRSPRGKVSERTLPA